MARKNIKKVTSRRKEFYGIRKRKGSSKFIVELRLPGQTKKYWGMVGNEEDAKRLVKLVRAYIDGEKAFPLDHPDLQSLKAFCKKEFEAFVWEEFQRNDATELLEDRSRGVDDNKTEEAMMPTNTPELGSVHSEVETCAGGAQWTTLAVKRALENVERLEHERNVALDYAERLEHERSVTQENVERLGHERNVALGILVAAAQAAQKAAARSAIEDFAPMLENGGVDAPPPTPTPFAAGPSDTTGFAHLDEIVELDAAPVPVVSEEGPLYARGFAPSLENGVLGSPSPALTTFEAGMSDTRGFAHMIAFAELDAQPTPVLLEASALYARGSIASPEHQDWSVEFFNFDEYSTGAS